MNDIPFTLLLLAVLVFIGDVMYEHSTNYLIPKNEWNCTQSKILDPNDVDKVQCIVYKKKNDTT